MQIRIPYVDFRPSTELARNSLTDAFNQVLDSGKFIMGDNVRSFESDFAAYCGTSFASGLANGTCSLHILFRVFDIGPGDEVITAPNSFIATAAAITHVGAIPVFVDTDWDFNIDVKLIEHAITERTKAIVPVHLTGRVAKMREILEIAAKHELVVIEDSAQSVGAEYHGKRAGSFGNASSFSFHPLKNLHAFGDAGMVCSEDERVVGKLNSLKNHGLIDRSTCSQWGLNCRLDEMQAAFLRVQLPLLDKWTQERREIAHFYNQELASVVVVPEEQVWEKHVYQTYVIRSRERDSLKNFLNERGVEALIHYPVPIHLQPAAKSLGYVEGNFPVVEQLAKEILSLPLYPGMPIQFQERVVSLIREFYAAL